MEAQAAFVWADCAVELYAVADVHMHFALVIYPWHTELMNALGLDNALHDLRFLKFRMLVVDIFN